MEEPKYEYIIGYFHKWVVVSGGLGLFFVRGLVEKDNGTIIEVPLENIRFLKSSNWR